MAVTRKEQIASGKKVTPLTREELRLAGKEFAPLTEDERFQKTAYSGGGGENPYTTATVIVTNNYNYDQTVALAWLNTEDGMIQSFVRVERNGGTKTVSAILYDGKCYANYEGSGQANVEGNVVVPDPDPGFIITGDATITIIDDK